MTFSFATLKKSKKPNSYLLAPAELCQSAAPDDGAPVLPLSEEDLFGKILSLIENDGQYRDISVDLAAQSISAVAVTKLFRFKDDIDIAILPAEQGSTLAIYSRSRIGHSDLGKNQNRVEALIAALGV